jgi:diguanylate cyclase (GGDEF)-like protein
MITHAIRNGLRIPSHDPDLMRSQVRAFSRQVPLLYLILLVNVGALSWTHFDVAPLALTTIVPGLLAAACLVRLCIWIRRGAVDVADRDLARRLATSVRLAAILGIVFLAWSLALFPYGDAYQQSHVAFFIGITLFGCIFCLMPLRPAALVLMGIVVVPFALFLAATERPVFVAVAVNIVLVAMAVIHVVFAYSRDFANLIAFQKELVDRHRAETKATRARAETELAAQRQLLKQAERFEVALHNMLHGLCMFDVEERLIVSNDRFATMYGIPDDLLKLGTKFRDLVSYCGNTLNHRNFNYDEMLACRRAATADANAGASMHELGDGRTILIRRQPTSDGGWIATHEDITERRQAERQIAHMANHDALTGLGNRGILNEKLEEALARVRRRQSAFAILLMDLDGFKHVNDTLGHAAGDELLRALTRRLTASVQQIDVLARLGGDEFAMIQIEAGNDAREAAADLAAAVLDVVCKPFALDGREVTIGASIGIALAPEDGTTPGELLQNADLALYRVKSEGRNNFRFFEKEMSRASAARLGMVNDLRQAVVRGEFELHYQPVFDAKTLRPSGVEALVRWRHPVSGLIPPDRFIPLAEETGLMEVLGEWILDRACRDAMAWPAHIKVAVNLSATQFRSGRLLDVILCALVESGLPPERLELEITESVLMQNTANSNAVLKQLKNIGVSIALDDFGTGYSSLSYLTTFPFDKIKIDKSFTQGLFERSDCAVIVASVLTLARGLNIEVTAEGVETEDQSALLDNAGVNLLQGFLFGRPQPAHELKFAAAQQDTAAVEAA